MLHQQQSAEPKSKSIRSMAEELNNVNIFPAQCLNAGDSFFAYEDSDSRGRIYTGIFASALPSHATAQVRVLSALLQCS